MTITVSQSVQEIMVTATQNGNVTTIQPTVTINSVVVSDEAYGPSWDGSIDAPTKNAIYDKLESLNIDGGTP